MSWPFVAFGLLILYLFIGILVSRWVAYIDGTDEPLIRFVIFWPLVLVYTVLEYLCTGLTELACRIIDWYTSRRI